MNIELLKNKILLVDKISKHDELYKLYSNCYFNGDDYRVVKYKLINNWYLYANEIGLDISLLLSKITTRDIEDCRFDNGYILGIINCSELYSTKNKKQGLIVYLYSYSTGYIEMSTGEFISNKIKTNVWEIADN